MDLPVDPQVQRNVERLELGFDVHGIDPFGVSKKALVHFYSVFAGIYRRYLRVTTFGMEHIPPRGRALLIGNHSGGIGADAAMVMTSLVLNDDHPRIAHGMADYFFNTWPFVSPLMSRVGHLTGLPEHAELLLANDRLVVAFPEGARGAMKLYRDRYQLVRFGTGFMRLAMKMKSPIVPFAFIGGEEAFPILFRITTIARMVGAPDLPVAPQLVLAPLPVSCQIHYGEPMFFEGDGRESDDVIDANVEKVKERIAELIAQGRAERPWAFTMRRVESPRDPTNPR